MYKTPIDHLLDNLERSAVVRGKVLLGMGLLQERSWEGGGYRSSNSPKGCRFPSTHFMLLLRQLDDTPEPSQAGG